MPYFTVQAGMADRDPPYEPSASWDGIAGFAVAMTGMGRHDGSMRVVAS